MDSTDNRVAATCSGRAVALTRFERPVGKTQSCVVTCECGWESKHTTDWRRSLDDHWRRRNANAPAAATTPSPTASEVYDRLREEWDALGLLSFTGDGAGGWRADLNQDDVKQIRALLRDAASLIEAYS